MDYFIALDAGHGILTTGKLTFAFADGTVMNEWEFNSAVMQKIYKKLVPYKEIDVFIVNSEKYDVNLDVRNERINNAWFEYQKKLGRNNVKGVLVSIHANAEGKITTWGHGNGTATFYHHTNMKDKAFAEVIQRNLIKHTGLNAHQGGLVASNFQITRQSLITACLCECAFMTNLKEAELLRTDEFREKCANGIVNGLLEWFEINQPKKEDDKVKPEYEKYSSRIHEIRGNPKDFESEIVNASNRSIKTPFCINNSFQWWEDTARKKPYPTSIFIQDGVILRNEANHLRDFNAPQSVIWVDKNGNPGMQRLRYAHELDYKNIKCAVGGLGLVNVLDKNFYYSPATEGFRAGYNLQGKWKDYTDVLRVSNKTVIGYNFNNDEFYLLAVKNMSMTELLEVITDNSKGKAYHLAVMGDGGGSVFMNNADDMVVYGDGRYIYAILGFGLS